MSGYANFLYSMILLNCYFLFHIFILGEAFTQHPNEPLLKVWVLCKDDGAIESAYCTCIAGLGEVCSHVGAILFYLESVFCVTKTCTQTDCRWKEPRLVEAMPYARIMDIPFTKPKSLISCNRKRGAHSIVVKIPLLICHSLHTHCLQRHLLYTLSL